MDWVFFNIFEVVSIRVRMRVRVRVRVRLVSCGDVTTLCAESC